MNLVENNTVLERINSNEYIAIVTSYDGSPIFKKLSAPESDSIYILNKKENLELGFSLVFLVNPSFLNFFQKLGFEVEQEKQPAIYVFRNNQLIKTVKI